MLAYNTAFLIGTFHFLKLTLALRLLLVDTESLANLWGPTTSNSSEHQRVQPNQNKAYLVLRVMDRQCDGALLESRRLEPSRTFRGTESGSKAGQEAT